MPRIDVPVLHRGLRPLFRVALCSQLLWPALAFADTPYDQMVRDARAGQTTPAPWVNVIANPEFEEIPQHIEGIGLGGIALEKTHQCGCHVGPLGTQVKVTDKKGAHDVG